MEPKVRKKILGKLRTAIRVFLGVNSNPVVLDELGTNYARNYTLAYVSVLLGGGIALSLGQIKDEPWFLQPSVATFATHLIEILTVIWVYFSALLSGWGTYGSARKHPIKSQRRFFCTWIILILYFPSFLKFKDLGMELFLLIPIFGLFVLWDLLKEREYPDEKQLMRPRTVVTVRWTIVVILVYGIFNLFPHPSPVDYGFLVAVFIAMWLYRLNKENNFLKIRGHLIL